MADATERLNLLLTLGRYADGERAAREAIGREPEYAAGYTFLALFLLNQGRAEPALVAARDGVRRAARRLGARQSGGRSRPPRATPGGGGVDPGGAAARSDVR